MMPGLPAEPSEQLLLEHNALSERYEASSELNSKAVQQADEIRQGKRKTTETAKVQQLSVDRVEGRVRLLHDTNTYLNGTYRSHLRQLVDSRIQKSLKTIEEIRVGLEPFGFHGREGEPGFLPTGIIQRSTLARHASAEQESASAYLQEIDRTIQANLVEISQLEDRLDAFRRKTVTLV